MTRYQPIGRTFFLALLVVAALPGCRGHMPHAFTWPAGGDVVPTHPKPPEGGYYSNWDPYAVELTVDPVEDVNPVRTQHVLVATVRDKDGKPLPNRRVEWIISEGSVGDIVEVDESGWRASRGYKVDNHYAVSHTNNGPHVLTRGNDDPSDDVALGEGQTWCVITSPVEGTSHVTVYAPGIYDWAKHKVFAVKHWMDVRWQLPPDAVNRVGSPHELVTRVMKHSDGAPLANYEVIYTLKDGPAGSFAPGGGTSISVRTDADGLARATLNQASPVEGNNTIGVEIVRPANEQCCKPAERIFAGLAHKQWIAPKLIIRKTAPARAEVGEVFEYAITAMNTSNIPADSVMVHDSLPPGMEFVSANPKANVAGSSISWSLGTMPGNAAADLRIKVRATRTGQFTNCAEIVGSPNLSDRACAETVVNAPALAIEIECVAEVMLCDAFPVRVTVRNTGDGVARNVDIQLPMPEGTATAGGKPMVAMRSATLAAGESKEATIQVKASHAGSFNFVATASAERLSPATAQCTTRVSEPKLEVSVRPGRAAPYYVGKTFDYEISVANRGDAVAKNSVVEANWTSGLSFSAASEGGSGRGNGAVWTLGDLAPGAEKTLRLTVLAGAIGDVTSQVTARAYCTTAQASLPLAVSGIPAILVEVIDIDDPVELGKTTTYDIRVTNQGSIDSRNVVVTAELPAEQEFVSASPGHQVAGQTVTFAPIARIAPKATATFRVEVKAKTAADVRFKVSVTSEQSSIPITETESTNQYE